MTFFLTITAVLLLITAPGAIFAMTYTVFFPSSLHALALRRTVFLWSIATLVLAIAITLYRALTGP